MGGKNPTQQKQNIKIKLNNSTYAHFVNFDQTSLILVNVDGNIYLQ